MNTLFDVMTAAQLERKVGEDYTILEDIITILKLALWRPYDGPLYLKEDKMLVKSAMTQVRTYIMTTLVPSLVNKTMPNLTPKTSLLYLELVEQIRLVDAHLKNYS